MVSVPEDTVVDGRSNASLEPGLRVWIDIENPPQVRYLVPLVRTFARRGANVLVTARDYGITYDLLREQEIDYVPVAAHFGAAKRSKVVGTLRRVRDLRRLMSGSNRPHLVISASRSASLTARSLGIPSFIHCDYEFADFSAYRVAGSYVLFPDVIATAAFRRRGVSASRLLPYHGIKEDITFTDIDVDAVDPYQLPGGGSRKCRVLFRPPAEEAHYHRAESSTLGSLAVAKFAQDPAVELVLSPRYEWQAQVVRELEWVNEPIVLSQAAPFVSLLKAVDVVASGGGTMTREAAYLGVPAISLFRGNEGEVDLHLEAAGRLTIVRSEGELEGLDVTKLARSEPLYMNRHAADDVVDAVVAAARGRADRAVAGN